MDPMLMSRLFVNSASTTVHLSESFVGDILGDQQDSSVEDGFAAGSGSLSVTDPMAAATSIAAACYLPSFEGGFAAGSDSLSEADLMAAASYLDSFFLDSFLANVAAQSALAPAPAAKQPPDLVTFSLTPEECCTVPSGSSACGSPSSPMDSRNFSLDQQLIASKLQILVSSEQSAASNTAWSVGGSYLPAPDLASVPAVRQQPLLAPSPAASLSAPSTPATSAPSSPSHQQPQQQQQQATGASAAACRKKTDRSIVNNVEDRQRDKRERNKISAANSRARKRDLIDTLSKRVEELEKEVRAVAAERQAAIERANVLDGLLRKRMGVS